MCERQPHLLNADRPLGKKGADLSLQLMDVSCCKRCRAGEAFQVLHQISLPQLCQQRGDLEHRSQVYQAGWVMWLVGRQVYGNCLAGRSRLLSSPH